MKAKAVGIDSESLLKKVEAQIKAKLQTNHVSMRPKIGFTRHEDDFWFFTVEPKRQPKETYPYYRSLAQAEIALRKKHYNVVLVPVLPE